MYPCNDLLSVAVLNQHVEGDRAFRGAGCRVAQALSTGQVGVHKAQVEIHEAQVEVHKAQVEVQELSGGPKWRYIRPKLRYIRPK